MVERRVVGWPLCRLLRTAALVSATAQAGMRHGTANQSRQIRTVVVGRVTGLPEGATGVLAAVAQGRTCYPKRLGGSASPPSGRGGSAAARTAEGALAQRLVGGEGGGGGRQTVCTRCRYSTVPSLPQPQTGRGRRVSRAGARPRPSLPWRWAAAFPPVPVPVPANQRRPWPSPPRRRRLLATGLRPGNAKPPRHKCRRATGHGWHDDELPDSYPPTTLQSLLPRCHT